LIRKLKFSAKETTTSMYVKNLRSDMEALLIQARPQITFVRYPGRCEDCEEEERQEALQEDITQDRVDLSQASLKITESSSSGKSSTENDLATESEGGEGSDSQSAGPKTELQLNDTSPEESPFSRHIKNQFSASRNPSSGNLLNIVS
jgi:hypothetical protein